MSTRAGTYVKEFVHGDCGCTSPSISSLLGGTRIDITELDCEVSSVEHEGNKTSILITPLYNNYIHTQFNRGIQAKDLSYLVT
jgi:uncharacterized OsmC-like protein